MPFGTGNCARSQLINELKMLLESMSLRYFTPREVARLHSFPAQFSFPPNVSLRQKYALLGNSLNVSVVAKLLCELIQ